MKTVQVTSFGGPEVLRVTQAPDPVAGPGQVVIDVEVVDVLYLDTQLRSGWGKEWFGQAPPYTPGSGVAGRVSRVGEGVDPAWVGRRVVAITADAYASRTLAPVEALAEVPDGLSLQEAAALVQTGTAAVSLVEAAAIQPGERVLVTGAAGGLGTLLVQLARTAGAHVTGAAGSERKRELVRELGADATGYADLGQADVVFDGVGGEVGTAAFATTADGGRFFAYGVPSGSFAAIDPAEAERRGIKVTGIEQVQFAPEEASRLAGQIMKMTDVKAVIGQTFALEDAAQAHRQIEDREAIGRTLLIVGASRAVRFAEHGEADVLALEEVELPEPGPGQVRIKVRAAGVNPVDWKIRMGFMGGTLPSGTGLELSGVVEAIGPGVTEFAAGQTVFGRVPTGAAATHAVADVADLVARPDWLTFEEAAALPAALETAHRTLSLLELTKGQTLLIHAAAGGVGLVAAQLARAWGAQVVGTASEGNHAYLRGLGVHPVTYGEGLAERVRAAAPQGIDAVLDAAGSDVLGLSVELTGDPDKVVTIADPGRAAEHRVRFSTGSTKKTSFATLYPLVESASIILPIAASFPLERTADAHRLSETGHLRGKIVISIEE